MIKLSCDAKKTDVLIITVSCLLLHLQLQIIVAELAKVALFYVTLLDSNQFSCLQYEAIPYALRNF